MKKQHFWFIALLQAGAISTGRSQSITPSILNVGGGSATVNGITFEYSIGEMVAIATAVTPNLIVTQGVLQPVTKSDVLPITLIRFVGVKMTGYNKLDWTTGTETGQTRFELQRSDDAASFSTINTSTALGLPNGSNYTYNDANPFSKQVYYRLKIMEDAGAVRYSNIVTLSNYETSYWTVFPNPVTRGASLQINVQNADVAKPVSITLYDAAGRKVLENKQSLINGFQTIRIAVPVPPGFYSLHVNGFLNNTTQKILVK